MENYEIEKNQVETLRNIFDCSSTRGGAKNNHLHVKILNIHRCREMLLAKQALDKILSENSDREESVIKLVPELCYGILSVEVESLEVRDKDVFALAVAYADNFEVFPLTNGRLRWSFMFYRMFKKLREKENGVAPAA